MVTGRGCCRARRGDLELRIPKLRAGSFFPSLLERRRRVDQSLFAVIMEAYLHGTSTRKVDDLVKALGDAPMPCQGIRVTFSGLISGVSEGW